MSDCCIKSGSKIRPITKKGTKLSQILNSFSFPNFITKGTINNTGRKNNPT
jgi:hypothetical protein